MSKATWDEEVEFDDKDNETPSGEMVANPDAQDRKDDEVEYSVSNDTDEEAQGQADDETKAEIDKIKYKLKAYDQLRRQNHAQLEQMRKLQAERDHFQTKALEQYESNLLSSEDILNNKLDIAKAKLELAIEQGNSGDIANANTEIANLTGDIRDLSKNRQELELIKAEENQKYQIQGEQKKAISQKNVNWFYGNPEFNPNNPNFDKKLQKEFLEYAREIDQELVAQGRGSVIGSSEYYDYFENVMDEYRAARNGASSANRNAQRSSYNAVAPVSRGNTGGSARATKGKQVVHITPEEARINKLWGISPKEHIEFTRSWKDKDFEMEY